MPTKKNQKYYNKSISQVLNELKSLKEGLSTKEAQKRANQYGKNMLNEKQKNASRLAIFFAQWKSPLILILVVATVVSAALGEIIDSTVIGMTTFLNVLIGYFQEYKASSALESLRKMVEYKAVVFRDGVKKEIDSHDLVPGDILFLEAGNKIQADARLIQANELQINEAALTGESEPIYKKTIKLSGDKRVGDQVNMVFRGTIITNGVGLAIVTSIGKNTEIGKIAELVSETEEEQTPLQIQLARLAKILSIIVVLISLGIFVIGLLIPNDESVVHLFETSIAVAVAAIPEGLVISLTVILAIGMQFILKRNALVRKLVAAETLGSVDVICTDKTGTLTEGKMRVAKIVTYNNDFEKKEIFSQKKQDDDLLKILQMGVVCNNASLENPSEKEKAWSFIGDTTEIALVHAAAKIGLFKHIVDTKVKRIDEVPFDSDRKFMATLSHDENGKAFIATKGAFERLQDKIAFVQVKGKKQKLTKKLLDNLQKKEHKLTDQGLRVLTICVAETTKNKKQIKEEDIKKLTFLGFVGIADPLRGDVKETIMVAKKAGIKVVMITGDHERTATSIGKELGIYNGEKSVMNGTLLETLSDKELHKRIKEVRIFARVDPKHKIRIVDALQYHGSVVAMTGDGVNDAPAIKTADIGIAVGSGTDVAKETSDMVILDDRFTTIVAAVREGRTIYQNIKKVVLYLLAGSFAEVVMVVGSILAGLPVAALPAQILWVNVIEDAFPTMALAFDKGDKDNMNDPPRKKNESLIDKEMKTMIIAKSILANVALFAIFVYFWTTTQDIVLARTIVFVGFAVDALFFIFSIRSLKRMVWQINPFDNKYLIGAVGFGWVMLLLAVYWGPLQLLLRTVPLTPEQWALMISFGMFNLFLMEFIKWLFLLKGRIPRHAS